MTRRSQTTRRAAAIACIIALSLIAGTTPSAQAPQRAAADIHILPLRGNIYVLSAGGVNIAASVGKDGVLLVDSGPAAMSDAILAAVRELSRRVTSAPATLKSCVGVPSCQWWGGSELLPTTVGTRAPRPIIGIVNTSDDPDHVGGNGVIGAAGHTYGVRNVDNSVPGAWVVAHENMALRLTQSGQQALVPNETYFGPDKKLNFVNGEGVIIMHPEAAHTDGDSMVYFRGSDILAAGDILDMSKYPVIDTKRGGSIEGVVSALNAILDVTVVEHMMEGGTIVVPGHGRMTDTADVAYYRDMVTIMRDRVREMITRKMTLAQIKALRLTKDYDGRYGRNPSWTPDMFIEAIYRGLTPKT